MAEPTKEEAAALMQPYGHLYSAFDLKTSQDKPVLLAHYTSVQLVEQILKNEELWLANPLYMNDLDEMRAGILLGNEIFSEYAHKAGGSPARASRIIDAHNHYLAHLQLKRRSTRMSSAFLNIL